MTNYFETNERIDYQLLHVFNKNNNLFDSIRPRKDGVHTDAIATHKERHFSIEIKRRNCSVYTYPTVYIEYYKVSRMLLDYQFYGLEPLYVCFYDDAVAVFNLRKLKTYPKTETKDIYSKGKEAVMSQERRYCLDINDAVIYHTQCQTKKSS